MNKKAVVLCFVILLIISGCQRRLSPNQPAPSLTPPQHSISAIYDRADFYHGVLTSDVQARSGMSGGTPVTYAVTKGTTVRVMGKYDGYYVTMLPNGQIALVPAGSINPIATAPIKQIPVTPGAPASNYPSGGSSPGGTPSGNNPSAGSQFGSIQPGVNQTGGLSPGGTTSGGNQTAGAVTGETASMINLVNQARTQAGLKALNTNPNLAGVASLKAVDIVNKNYFSHTSPTYGSPFDMMKTYGISYLYAGENLAIDMSVSSAEQALMNSPTHKANILSPNFTDIGVGVCQRADGSRVYVQEFIGK
jgi:uncharacterized YkwD family protein